MTERRKAIVAWFLALAGAAGIALASCGCKTEYGWWTHEPALPHPPTNVVERLP